MSIASTRAETCSKIQRGKNAVTSFLIYVCICQKNIYSQLYYTKLLSDCKFQHTSKADKVKARELSTSS